MHVPLWLTIALIVVGISLIVAYLAALWAQYQPILAGIGQVLAGIGVGSIIGGLGLLLNFLKYQKESKEKRDQRLRKHTKILNDDVYKKLSYICVETYGSYGRKRQLEIPVDVQEYARYELETRLRPLRMNEIERPILFPLSRLESLNLGIDHLKHRSYRDTYNAWARLNCLIDEYNTLVDSLDAELYQALKKKMHDNFPELVDRESGRTSEVTNFYYPRQIIPFIAGHVDASLLARSQPSFENTLEIQRVKEYQDQPPSSYPWLITAKTFLNIPLLSSATEIDLERLRSTLIKITQEGEIRQKVDRLINIRHIDIAESHKTFENGIRKLSKEIDDRHDDFLIDGKCDKCKKWNK
jgi:hypothetical protein